MLICGAKTRSRKQLINDRTLGKLRHCHVHMYIHLIAGWLVKLHETTAVTT